MKKKNTNIGILKIVLVISVTLLIFSLAIMPTPNSVYAGKTTVNIELEAGWNFKSMPESISASDLALKSKHITNIVHNTSDGDFVSYIASLGATDFICEPNEGIYIYSEADTIISFTIIDPGDISGDLFVTGDTILNKNLTVNGSMSVAGDLEINSLNVIKDLTVDGDLTVNENLTVGNDMTVSGSLIVGEDLTVGDLTITEDLTINDDLSVIGDAIIDGDSTVAGDSTTGGDSTVAGDMRINGNLIVAKDATIGGNSIVIGDMTINDDLSVAGDSTVGGDSIVVGDMTINDDLSVAGDSTIGDDLTVGGNSTVNGNLSVAEDAAIGDDLTVAGNSTVDGNLSVAGDAAIGDDLMVVGNLSVAKDAAIGDDLTVAGDTIIDGNLSVEGDAAIGDDLTVAGDTIIDSNLSVGKDAAIGDDLFVGGDVTIGGNLTAGNLKASDLVVDKDVLISGNLSVIKDVTIGGNLTAGNFTVNDDFTINGDYSITANMTVGGDLVVSGNITGIALGDMADYVISRDNTGVIYARNGATGDLDFQSTNATEVIQNAIDAIYASDRNAGMIYLKRSSVNDAYNIPLRFNVAVDYTIDSTIRVYPGISIISDGALLKVSDLNDTVFELNPLGADYGSPHLIWKISGLAFVGHSNNTNTVAIHAYRWQYSLIIDNIHCEEVTNPIKIEGTAYRTVVQNCLFIVGAGNRGEIGVHIFKGRGQYSPNGATVVNSDVSTFKTGIQVDDGYGVRITSNYFEGNDIAVNSSGGTVTVVGNYFQPGYNQIGILAYGGTVISGNGFLLGRSAEYAKGIVMVRNEGSIMITGNTCGTDSGNNSFFYSDVPVRATITGNLVGLRPKAIASKFIDAYLTGATVSGNQINRGNPAIIQKMSPAWQQNTFSNNNFFSSEIAIVTGGRDCIIDNVFNACGTDIQLNGSNNVVRGNYLRGGVRINTSGMGAGNIIEGNIGYVTENSGTTSAGTTIVVTHGLAGTPDQVTVTPLGQTNYYYITSKGMTTFTIISEASVAFDWNAVYKP